MGGVHPHEERRARFVLPLDVVDAGAGGVVVDGLHPLGVQRSGVLDGLLADGAELRIVGFLGDFVGGLALQHAARQGEIVQLRELVGVRVVELLGLLLGVEVIEVAVELVEAVHGRQVLVLVAEMVLAELAGRIAERLEQFGDRGVLRGPADVGTGHADLAHASAVHALSADERRAAGSTALLTVGVGEPHALVGDAVDVRGAVTHQAVAVATEIADSDVVAPDHQDVRFAVRHCYALLLSAPTESTVRLDLIATRTSWVLLQHAGSQNLRICRTTSMVRVEPCPIGLVQPSTLSRR